MAIPLRPSDRDLDAGKENKMSNSDPYREASRFHNALKRADKWRDDYVNAIVLKHNDKVRALRAELSPAAQRIVAAAEEPEDCQPPAMDAEPAALGWTPVEELGRDAEKLPPVPDDEMMTEDEMSRETVKAQMKAARKAGRG